MTILNSNSSLVGKLFSECLFPKSILSSKIFFQWKGHLEVSSGLQLIFFTWIRKTKITLFISNVVSFRLKFLQCPGVQLSARLTLLGIMEAQLMASFKPRPSQLLWWSERVSGGALYAPRENTILSDWDSCYDVIVVVFPVWPKFSAKKRQVQTSHYDARKLTKIHSVICQKTKCCEICRYPRRNILWKSVTLLKLQWLV